MTMAQRFTSRYRGKRYHSGYPACPNLEDQAARWRLLKPGEIGVQLTEGFTMDPEASDRVHEDLHLRLLALRSHGCTQMFTTYSFATAVLRQSSYHRKLRSGKASEELDSKERE
jgi:hypothetical protein